MFTAPLPHAVVSRACPCRVDGGCSMVKLCISCVLPPVTFRFDLTFFCLFHGVFLCFVCQIMNSFIFLTQPYVLMLSFFLFAFYPSNGFVLAFSIHNPLRNNGLSMFLFWYMNPVARETVHQQASLLLLPVAVIFHSLSLSHTHTQTRGSEHTMIQCLLAPFEIFTAFHTNPHWVCIIRDQLSYSELLPIIENEDEEFRLLFDWLSVGFVNSRSVFLSHLKRKINQIRRWKNNIRNETEHTFSMRGNKSSDKQP